jgi:protein involved in polysaccharide export with SLBB domain
VAAQSQDLFKGISEVIRSRVSYIKPIGLAFALAGCFFALAPERSRAQDAGALRKLPAMNNQCGGPLGSLLSECQSGKGSITIPTPAPPEHRGGSAAEVAHSGSSLGEAPRQPTPAALPPENVTEFQRLVASSTGKHLPIFGASLFGEVPTTFAPLDRVPMTANYVIGPGDELLLRVWGQVNLDVALTVDRAGSVYLPQAGNVAVAGLEFQQLPSYLKAQLSRVFRNFDLNVNMGQLRSIQIFVVGRARRPGAYTVSSLSTLVNALFASGGPSAEGSMRHIQLKRGENVETEFDLYDLLLRGDKSKDNRLLPGDVVYIPPVGPQVAIAGSVKTAGVYELNRESSVGDLVQMAGGLSAVADVQRSVLERIKDRASRETVELPLNAAGMATAIRDGDLLRVLPITPRFENAVTLRGNVAEPGRFSWRAGMRVRDVIPDKEALVTRDYWKKRNELGERRPETTDVGAAVAGDAQRKPTLTNVETSVPDINWSYAVIERQNPRDLSTELISFHLGKLVLERDDRQNLELRPGDVVTVFSQKDIRVAMAQQTRFVRLEGEFNGAGVYAVRPGETLGQLVERVGGLTPQAYLFGAEFTRETTRHDQQRRLDEFVRDMQVEVERTATTRLGADTAEETAAMAAKLENERRIIERLRSVQPTGRIVLNLEPEDRTVDKLMGITLEDGDRFVVPARPATINVMGAVYNQNALLHESRLRLADYLRKAGGTTRNADTGRTFIIRADGSIIPKHGFNPLVRSFDATLLNPGDSIVVPEAMFKTPFMRSLRDWSQVIAQFALGAAAINIFR